MKFVNNGPKMEDGKIEILNHPKKEKASGVIHVSKKLKTSLQNEKREELIKRLDLN